MRDDSKLPECCIMKATNKALTQRPVPVRINRYPVSANPITSEKT